MDREARQATRSSWGHKEFRHDQKAFTFTLLFTKHTKEIVYRSFSNWQKIKEEWRLPNSFYEATVTLIPKPEKKKERKLKANNFDEYKHKNPQQNFSKPNPTYIKKIIYHHQVGFIPGSPRFFNICKSISVIHHISKKKDKSHMTISIDAEKAFDKIQPPLMTKILPK